MKFSNSFSAFCVCAGLIVAAAAANGQTSRDITRATERADNQAATESGLTNPVQQLIEADAKGILGAWRVTVNFEDGFTAHVVFNFAPGRKATEGTLTDINDTELLLPVICTSDQGVWERTAWRTFIATQYTFCFDTTHNNEPAGTAKVREQIQLNAAGDQLTGTQYVEILDNDGNVLDTFVGEMTGTRIKAEAPPASALNGHAGAQAEAVPDKLKPQSFFRRRTRLVR